MTRVCLSSPMCFLHFLATFGHKCAARRVACALARLVGSTKRCGTAGVKCTGPAKSVKVICGTAGSGYAGTARFRSNESAARRVACAQARLDGFWTHPRHGEWRARKHGYRWVRVHLHGFSCNCTRVCAVDPCPHFPWFCALIRGFKILVRQGPCHTASHSPCDLLGAGACYPQSVPWVMPRVVAPNLGGC